MEVRSKESSGFWEKLENIDHRILYWILIVAIAIPYLRPLGIPVPVTEPVQDFYNTLDALPPGSTMILEISSGPSAYGEIGPSSEAVMEYLTKIYPEHHGGDRLRFVILSVSEQGPLMYNAYAKPKFDETGWQYGVDYAYFGFISGLETAVARLAEDIPSLLPSDYLGNDIDDLKAMDGIHSYKDIAAVMVWDSMGATEWYVKHWASKGVKVGNVCVAVSLPAYTMYYKNKDMYGFIGSSRGGAEFEYLIGKPGDAVATTDTLSLSHLWVIILIITGNIGLLVEKYFSHSKR